MEVRPNSMAELDGGFRDIERLAGILWTMLTHRHGYTAADRLRVMSTVIISIIFSRI